MHDGLRIIMERVPEDELMNNPVHARAYAETDFSEPHESFVDHFAGRFPDFSEGDVLDIGCGPADVTLRFALRYPYTRITGIDGAEAMLDLAAREVSLRHLTHRVTLKYMYLPSPSLQVSRYNAIISNSLLHHLADPSVLWQAIKSCAADNAPVFIMDLLRPETVEEAGELVLLHAADTSDVLREDFFNSLLAAYTTEEVRDQLREHTMSGFKIEKISDRHMIIWGKMTTHG